MGISLFIFQIVSLYVVYDPSRNQTLLPLDHSTEVPPTVLFGSGHEASTNSPKHPELAKKIKEKEQWDSSGPWVEHGVNG